MYSYLRWNLQSTSSWKGHLPFKDLDAADEIMERFRCGQFPAMSEQLVADIARRCWAGQYGMAEEVEHGLKEMRGRA